MIHCFLYDYFFNPDLFKLACTCKDLDPFSTARSWDSTDSGLAKFHGLDGCRYFIFLVLTQQHEFAPQTLFGQNAFGPTQFLLGWAWSRRPNRPVFGFETRTHFVFGWINIFLFFWVVSVFWGETCKPFPVPWCEGWIWLSVETRKSEFGGKGTIRVGYTRIVRIACSLY